MLEVVLVSSDNDGRDGMLPDDSPTSASVRPKPALSLNSASKLISLSGSGSKILLPPRGNPSTGGGSRKSRSLPPPNPLPGAKSSEACPVVEAELEEEEPEKSRRASEGRSAFAGGEE